MKTILEFKVFETSYYIEQIIYKNKQIGTIQQSKNDDKFFANFGKSDFYWFDYVLKGEMIQSDYDLDELKSNIRTQFAEVVGCC